MSGVRKHPKFSWPFSLYPAAMLLVLAAVPSAAQMGIDTISISSGPAYNSGSFTDFFIEPELTGSGITSVELSRENGGSIFLTEGPPGTWFCEFVPTGGACDFFPTLQDVRDLGDLTFDVTFTNGSSDSIVIPFEDWDPGAGQTGFPVITSPTPNEFGVSLTPTFTWNTPPGWVEVIFAQVLTVSQDEVVSAQLAGTAVSWATDLSSSAATSFEFGLSFFDVFFFEEERTSPGLDSYLFSSGFQAFNFVPFSTSPPPTVPGLGGIGVMALVVGLVASGRAALGRRERS